MIKRKNHMQIAPRVMIEILVAEGITYAGWYGPESLECKFNEVTGNFMNDGFRRTGARFGDIQKPGYLPGDRRVKTNRPTVKTRKMWWEDLGL